MLRAWKVRVEEGVERAVRDAVKREGQKKADGDVEAGGDEFGLWCW